jgi:hypothetical protein
MHNRGRAALQGRVKREQREGLPPRALFHCNRESAHARIADTTKTMWGRAPLPEQAEQSSAGIKPTQPTPREAEFLPEAGRTLSQPKAPAISCFLPSLALFVRRRRSGRLSQNERSGRASPSSDSMRCRCATMAPSSRFHEIAPPAL